MKAKVNKHYVACFFICLIIFGITYSYYDFFAEYLARDQHTDAGGFTSIIIPDTFLYKGVIDEDLMVQSILLSTVKNTIGPSFLWVLASSNWVNALIMNAIFIFFILQFLIKIAHELMLPPSMTLRNIFLFALLPTTLYFAIGALKEIPCLFGMLGFFYHYLKRNRVRYGFFIFFLFIFRYQLAFPLLAFIGFDMFKKKSFLYVLIFLSAISFLYPFLKLDVFTTDATSSFREANGVAGSLGSIIEVIRASIPGLSLIAIVIRVVQSIFEPIFNFLRTPSFYEEGNLSIYVIVKFFGILVLSKYWIYFFKTAIKILKNPKVYDQSLISLYSLCFLILIPTGGFSFIQDRYLYPITGLMILASIYKLPKRKVVRADIPETSPVMPMLPVVNI